MGPTSPPPPAAPDDGPPRPVPVPPVPYAWVPPDLMGSPPFPSEADTPQDDTPPGFDVLHPSPDERPTGLASSPNDPGAKDRSDATASRETRESWRAWASWGSLGIEFAAGIVVFFLLGSWADATWGTDPWLRVAGAFVGIVLGTYLLIKKALAANTDERADPPARKPSEPSQRS